MSLTGSSRVLETSNVYEDDIATTAATATGSGATTSSTATDFSSQLIKQTESHWSVSGTSVVAAWIACLAGAVTIVLLFSWWRTKDPMLFLPRYRQLVDKELLIHDSRMAGNYHALIPSSDPKKDLEVLEWQTTVIDGQERVGVRQSELQAPFLGWLRPALNDFTSELKFWNSEGTKKRDERILKTLGLDAFTMLEFLRLFRWLFALISVFVAIPLLCANYFINTETKYGSTSLTLDGGSGNSTGVSDHEAGVSLNNMTSVIGDLQLYTAANIKGDSLWVHVMAEWAVSLLVLLQVRIYARRHDRAIEAWSDMNQNEVSFKRLMLTRLEVSRKLTIVQAKAEILSWLRLKGGEGNSAST